MVIRVSEIPAEGLSVEGAQGFPNAFGESSWRLDGVALLLEKDGDEVLVRGRVSASIPQVCGRCVEAFTFRVSADVDTRFAPRPRGRRDEEVELTPEDLEMDFYADDLLDLDRLVQTEAMLGLPMKPLCRPGCRGLCPVCGGNRNANPCSCEVKPPDPRLAVLKSLAERLSSR
ncbi:MAG: DUF177 domain-containing protein [Candidatus Methylomirabilia bacterium]